jgi:hypothetical protein
VKGERWGELQGVLLRMTKLGSPPATKTGGSGITGITFLMGELEDVPM